MLVSIFQTTKLHIPESHNSAYVGHITNIYNAENKQHQTTVNVQQTVTVHTKPCLLCNTVLLIYIGSQNTEVRTHSNPAQSSGIFQIQICSEYSDYGLAGYDNIASGAQLPYTGKLCCFAPYL